MKYVVGEIGCPYLLTLSVISDVVEFVYLLIELFSIFDTADVETPVFLAISAMGMPYSEKRTMAIRKRTLQTG